MAKIEFGRQYPKGRKELEAQAFRPALLSRKPAYPDGIRFPVFSGTPGYSWRGTGEPPDPRSRAALSGDFHNPIIFTPVPGH